MPPDQGASKSERGVPRANRREAAWLAAATSLGATAIFFIVAAFWYSDRCGDSCGGGPGWTGHRDAVMWGVQFWAVAVPAALAIVLYVFLLARGRPYRAAAALVFALVAIIVWSGLPSWTGAKPGHWPVSVKPASWALLVLMVGGAIASIMLEVLNQRPKRSSA